MKSKLKYPQANISSANIDPFEQFSHAHYALFTNANNKIHSIEMHLLMSVVERPATET